jgi:hypothetical protein
MKATGVQAALAARDLVAADDLVAAMAQLWLLIQDPPRDLLLAYRNITEEALGAAAQPYRDQLATGRLSCALSGNLAVAALQIGGQLRALDAELAARSRFRRPATSKHSLLCKEADVFVVPRTRPKSLDKRPGPGNGFGRRATPHHRILPRRIDDAFEVELFWIPSLSFAPFGGEEALVGAALLPGLSVDWKEGRDGQVAGAAPCTDERGSLNAQVTAAFSSQLLAASWPELTMPPERRQRLQTLLRKKSDVASPLAGPTIVVAGTWHEEEGDVVRNVMRVLDKSGYERLRFDKITTFVGGGVQEGNSPARTIPILVNEDALVTFAICSDFCDLDVDIPYRLLDVDLILVPSLGNEAALNGHKGNARKLNIAFGTSTHVVQQHEQSNEPLGWVLPERTGHPSAAENEIWSERGICFR